LLLPLKKKADEETGALLRRERAARKAAEAALQMKGEFLSTLSHELRTPLSAILLWARILREGKLNQTERREAVETIERNAAAQAEIIDNMMDVSRMASGKSRLNVRLMEMQPAVEAAVKAARRMAEAKGLSLQTDLDSSGFTVRADPAFLQQATWMLLADAIRCTPAGGQIKVVLRRAAKFARLQVVDHGGGLNGRDGSLSAMARQLVTVQGGTIRTKITRSAVTITIELLLHRPETSSGVGFAPSQSLRGRRIILVEVEADTRNVLRWMLEQTGAQVQTADSASGSIKLLSGVVGEAGVLVCDISDSGMEDFELMRKAGAMNGAGKVAAIAISARADEQTRQRALKAGFKALMAKPIDPQELVSLIAQVSRPVK
jgi:CheY-like chemotaxis protein